MTTLMISLFGVAVLLYAVLWHNQPARPRRDEKNATEAVFNFLLDFYLPTKLLTLVAGFAIAKVTKKIMGLKTSRQRMSSRSTNSWPVEGELKHKVFASRRMGATHQTIK